MLSRLFRLNLYRRALFRPVVPFHFSQNAPVILTPPTQLKQETFSGFRSSSYDDMIYTKIKEWTGNVNSQPKIIYSQDENYAFKIRSILNNPHLSENARLIASLILLIQSGQYDNSILSRVLESEFM